MPKIVDKDRMRGAILDAALAAFGEKGFHAATIADVAAAAGLGKGTLYLYFRNKDALAEALVARHFDAMAERLTPADAPGDLDGFLDRIVAALDVPEEAARFLPVFFEVFGPSFAVRDFRARVAAVFDGIAAAWAEGLAGLQAAGQVRADLEAPVLARMLVAQVDGLVLHAGLFGAVPDAAAMRAVLAAGLSARS